MRTRASKKSFVWTAEILTYPAACSQKTINSVSPAGSSTAFFVMGDGLFCFGDRLKANSAHYAATCHPHSRIAMNVSQ
jgi:hypothetical protein